MKKISSILASFVVFGFLVNSVSAEPLTETFQNDTVASLISKEKAVIQYIEPFMKDLKEHGTLYFESSQNSQSLDNSKKLVISLPKDSLASMTLANALTNLRSTTYSDMLEVREVEGNIYSSNELQQANIGLYNRWNEFVKLGAEITSTYTDEEIDKVIVEATNISEQAKSALDEAYGDIIELRVSPEHKGGVHTISRTGNNSIIGGGVAINNSSCTVAATAKKGTERYIITAEHCLSSGGDGKTAVNQNTSKVGVEWSTAGNGQDIGLIKITESGRQISNGVIKSSTTSYDGYFNGDAGVIQGQSVCKSGITTGYTCSTVTSTSFTPTISGVIRPDQIKISNPNYSFQNNGDSGAPLFSLNTLHGVMSGKSSVTGTDAWASATKISTFHTYWSDLTLFTYGTPY